jgi:hypothetical protein
MKSVNIVRDSIDKLNSQRVFKRKTDTYCVYKKCKNYKLRNKNLCRPHEKKIVNESTYYTKILVAVVVMLSIYFMYQINFVYQGDFVYQVDFDTGFKYVGENVKKMMEYSMYIFSNVDTYINNTYSNVNMCSILTDIQDKFFVTENTICYILTDIQNKFFEYI